MGTREHYLEAPMPLRSETILDLVTTVTRQLLLQQPLPRRMMCNQSWCQIFYSMIEGVTHQFRYVNRFHRIRVKEARDFV